MLLRLIYDDKLAQASYLLGCQTTGEAMVVDANRDADQYILLAKKEGVRITHVTETHIHADYLSGSRELAHRTGAKLYLSANGTDEWRYRFPELADATLLEDNACFSVGRIRIDVIHTPGHTPEHICFIVTDTAASDQPIGIFSGDFVFVGDVGRPDLLEKAAGIRGTMEAGARDLYRSLQRFRELPDYLQVWPGHGAGSACGKALGAVPQTTVGYEKLTSPAFAAKSEDEFIEFVLSGQPEPPKYFAVMKRLNKEGPPLLNQLPTPSQLGARELDECLNAGVLIIDTRPAESFAEGHVRGTISIPYNKSFTTWAGWLVSYDRDFAIIVDEHIRPADVARDLALIGLDRIRGYFTSEAVTARTDLQKVASINTADMVKAKDALVIDVRGSGEWNAGHIPGTTNIPLGYLADHIDELPRDKPIVMHCQSGGRSAIATSILQAHGFENVVNVKGGYEEWAKGSPRS